MTSYTVRLPVYEGPLDLLLELIERAELDITKVALAQVTDQYLSYLRRLETKDPWRSGVVSWSSRRGCCRSSPKRCLPRPPEREAGEEDPGDALARQLMLYKRFKERRARALGPLRGRMAHLPAALSAAACGSPPRHGKHTAGGSCGGPCCRPWRRQPPRSGLSESVTAPKVNIRQKIRLIFEALRRQGRTTFRSLIGQAGSRLEIVVSFLAVLELIKQRQVQAQQDELVRGYRDRARRQLPPRSGGGTLARIGVRRVEDDAKQRQGRAESVDQDVAQGRRPPFDEELVELVADGERARPSGAPSGRGTTTDKRGGRA